MTFLPKLSRVGLKLSGLTCFLLLGVILLMAHLLLEEAQRSWVYKMETRTEALARFCREALLPRLDLFSLHFQVKELLKEEGVESVAVLDAGGKILSHSHPERIGERESPPPPQKIAEETRISLPILVGRQRIGSVRVGWTPQSMEKALWKAKRKILFIAFGAILLSILGTFGIVGWIMRPVPLLAEAAKEIGRGNLKVRVPWSGRDEIGLLAHAFNEMAWKNSLLFHSLKEEKEKLEIVFSEMREGAFWVNPEGGVILINAPARRLLGFPESPPKTLLQAFAEFRTQPSPEALLSQKEKLVECEFARYKPKLLILSGTSGRLMIDDKPAGFLIVFRDATREKQEEKLAQDFLSLVSHKLRTPITAVLGFLSVAFQDSKNLEEFQKQAIQTARRQGEKLKYLVDKLLSFISLQKRLALEKKACPLGELIQEALKEMAAPLKDTVLQLELGGGKPESLPTLLIDPWCLKEALKNLLENAVKFNPHP